MASALLPSQSGIQSRSEVNPRQEDEMKRTWILALAAALAIPTVALADSPKPEPIPAWCGGSYGSDGSNFGECVGVEQKVQVAGQASGLQEQTVRVPTRPASPSAMVDRVGEFQGAGGDGAAASE
jgi:hypothetical protein